MTMEIANTILAQLGGRKFLAMTGAKNLFGSDEERTLQFQLPRSFAKDGINAVRVKLEESDTYTVTFYKVGTARTGYAHKTVREVSDVYADSLRAVFTETTGLETSLGTMGG